MKNMTIIEIDRLGDGGDLTISDGEFFCVAFCWPCEYSPGDILKEPIHARSIKNLMVALDDTISIEPAGSPFVHQIHAKVMDIEKSIVAVGDIIIELDEMIPGWTKNGDYIECSCYLEVW